MKSDRTENTMATEGDDMIEHLNHEYHYGTTANQILNNLTSASRGFNDDTVDFITQLIQNEANNSKPRARHAGLAMDRHGIDELSTTIPTKEDLDTKQGVRPIVNMMKDQLKDMDKQNEVIIRGEAKTEEVVFVNSKKKATAMASIIKLNNLDEVHSEQLERYFLMGDYGEKIDVKFSLYKILGGLKKVSTLNIMKMQDNKRNSDTNQTILTKKSPTLEHSMRLPKQRYQPGSLDFESSVQLLISSNKINFNDTQTINKKFKIKKMSLANAHQLSNIINTQGSSKQDDDEDIMNAAEIDVIEVHQFATHVPMRFDKLSRYAINFLKKFVKKKIINAYVHEMRRTNLDQTAKLTKFVSFSIIERESTSNAQRMMLEDENKTAMREKNIDQIRKLNQMKLKHFPIIKSIITDKELLKTTLKADAIFGNPPIVTIKASKYYKKKKTTIKK